MIAEFQQGCRFCLPIADLFQRLCQQIPLKIRHLAGEADREDHTGCGIRLFQRGLPDDRERVQGDSVDRVVKLIVIVNCPGIRVNAVPNVLRRSRFESGLAFRDSPLYFYLTRNNRNDQKPLFKMSEGFFGNVLLIFSCQYGTKIPRVQKGAGA